MKLLVLSLLLAASHGFVVSPSTPAPNTVLEASSGLKMSSQPAKYTTPIREKRLSGIGQRYEGTDGSTILAPSFRLSLEIAAMAPLIWFMHSGTFVFGWFRYAIYLWVCLQCNLLYKGIQDVQCMLNVVYYKLKECV